MNTADLFMPKADVFMPKTVCTFIHTYTRENAMNAHASLTLPPHEYSWA